MKKKNQKLLIIVEILLLFGGISLAYFVSNILLNGNGANTKITTTANIKGATLKVEGTLNFEVMEMYPGHKDVSAIKVTATGNNELIPYNLIWKGTNTLTTPLKFTIYKTSEEINVIATCNKKTQIISGAQTLSEECTISNIDKLGTEIAIGTINKNDTKVTLAKDEFVTAVNNGISYYYYIILEYPNLDEPQNYDLEGSIDGEVKVEESNTKPDINILAAYVVQEDGTYKEVDDIPQSGYQLNNEKSTCSNGTVPNWDTKTHTFSTFNLTKSGTSCYLYFDKYIEPSKATLNKLNIENIKTDKPDFSTIATTDEGVYAVSDGMYGGTSYYWRGATTNNYIKFAGFCWRIIRINGDGSIRLIYDGTTCHANGSNSESIVKTSIAYNTNNNQSNFVGWTYSGTSQRTLSETSNNAKLQLEIWYNESIIGTNTLKIAQGKYCNDRNVQSGQNWFLTEKISFNYASYDRIHNKYQPTLECDVGDTYILNVGLVTADEVEMAGGNSVNKSYYLYNNQNYWTMSPYAWDGSDAQMFIVDDYGSLYRGYVNYAYGLRPVINLRSDVTFNGGNGTLDNPYIVAN